MLIVIPYSHADLDQARSLLVWIKELDHNLPQHELLLLASSRISTEDVKQMDALGRDVFPRTQSIKQSQVCEGPWPKASNGMFRTALEWVKQSGRGHWAWVEPDAIPMMPQWLDMLDAEYRKHGKPFMGAVYDKPFRHLNGCMLYPQNPGQFNHWMFGANEIPFDCIRPEVTIRHAHITNLIWRSLADPNRNQPHTFPDAASLGIIPRGTVLAHCCKNNSLTERLREQRGLIKPNGRSMLRKGLSKVFGAIKPTLVVRRTGAIGDALAATCVANKLVEHGYKVIFQCHPTVQSVLKYCPGITVANVSGDCDVNLDNCYESDPNRNTKHFADMFIGTANTQLAKHGINLKPLNIAPVLKVKEKECQKLMAEYSDFPRPWVAICPKSNSFNVRTVPNSIWADAARYMNTEGTLFWLGTEHSPGGIVDLEFRDIAKVVKAIATMDLVVAVDTGPCHISSALGIPMIVIEQASSPDVHLPEQRDWSKLSPENLTCLNCGEHVCPLDKDSPPCQFIDPHQIATAVNKRLDGMSSESVSAVVAIYRPSAQMLNQCLTALIPQVEEIVVCRDKAGTLPTGAMQHPKVRYLTSRLHDSGYARKLNFGVRHTHNKWVAAITDDVVLDSDAIHEMLKVGQKSDRIGMVGMRLWYPGRKTIQHGGTRRNPGDIGWGHINHRESVPSITKPTMMENVTGAAVLMRRKAFYDVGGYDESFFLYYEDNDHALKLRKAGWEIWFAPDAEGTHDEHSSTRITSEISPCVQRSRVIFTEKWQEYFDHNRDTQLGNFDYIK